MRTLAILPLVFVFGCAHKQQTKAEATPPAPAPAPVANNTPPPAPSNDTLDPSACYSVRVHFAFNESDIDSADRDGLERAARCLSQHSDVHITIAGSADERGTEEYNMALGDRRAHAVADYLKSLGASDAQLATVSYGKERPLCKDHDEACWQQNRRADLMAQNTATPKHSRKGHRK